MSRAPRRTHRRIAEAIAILVDLDMPDGQRNERTALVLLALAGIRKPSRWTEAGATGRLGITEMMDWMRTAYGKAYAPNTRETVRRQSVHQLIEAGLVRRNIDRELAINSPDNRYALAPEFAQVLRAYGSSRWHRVLASFLAKHRSLKKRNAQHRAMAQLPVVINTPHGVKTVHLSPCGQNPLIQQIIAEFCPRFTPGAVVAYLGDSAAKHGHHDRRLLSTVGIATDDHGKMPDVILVHQRPGQEPWLVLVEAVTSHGPMDPKRVRELTELFSGCTMGKVFVTAFPDQRTMVRYARAIAWETEVWIAEHPTHLIHYNGDRFLGPH